MAGPRENRGNTNPGKFRPGTSFSEVDTGIRLNLIKFVLLILSPYWYPYMHFLISKICRIVIPCDIREIWMNTPDRRPMISVAARYLLLCEDAEALHRLRCEHRDGEDRDQADVGGGALL